MENHRAAALELKYMTPHPSQRIYCAECEKETTGRYFTSLGRTYCAECAKKKFILVENKLLDITTVSEFTPITTEILTNNNPAVWTDDQIENLLLKFFEDHIVLDELQTDTERVQIFRTFLEENNIRLLLLTV